MSRIIHLSVSIRGTLLKSDAALRRELEWWKRADGTPCASVMELRRALMDQIAAGNDLLPTGPCEGFDPKKGCPGHVEP